MAQPSKINYDHLYIIAHALNDGVGDKIHECENFKGGNTPGWEREDAADNQYELKRLREAKVFAEALVLFADKRGRLNPLEEERVMLGIAAEAGLFEHPPKLSFFVMNPRDEQKVLEHYLERRHAGESTTDSMLSESMMKARAIPPSMWLEAFLKDTPALVEELHEHAKPAIELRRNIKEIHANSYHGTNHVGGDLLQASMYFSSHKQGHFKKEPPADFTRIETAFRDWEGSLRNAMFETRPLKRTDLHKLARSADVVADVRDTIAAHSDWPPLRDDEAQALSRLNYVAGEVSELMNRRYASLAGPKRGIAPDDAARPDGTSRGKADS